MKKFTLLLMTMFAVSIFAVGQIKLLLHLNDTEEPLEFIATTVDSITFAGIAVEPEDPEKPEDPDNPIKPEDPNKYENGYEYVDLGLSVMWASCNVGAKSPEEMGDSYSWGGTKAYINAPFEYEENYPWKNENGYTKYNSNPEEGIVDNKTKLDLEDDAAHVKMGGKWRLPSENEIRELVENCIITITTKEGVEGLVFTAQNGNSIFIPIIKESYHKISIIRSSELYQGDYRLTTPIMNVWDIDMDFDNYYTISTGIQEFGREALIPVRGVFTSEKTVSYPEPNLWVSGTSSNHEYVDLGLSVKWATCNLGASSKTGMGMKYRWAETTPTLNDNFDYDSDYNNFLDEKYNNKTTLAKEDDAAYASWGGEWRTPTFGELLELREKCIWKQVVIDNVKGFQITGPNGNAIFLPLNEDWSDYMSSTTWYVYRSSTTKSYDVGTLNAGIFDAMEYIRFASIGANYTTFYNRPVLGEQNRVTLRLDANNGKGEIAEKTDVKGTPIDLSKYIFTKTGYVFTGWNTQADGKGLFYPMEQIFLLDGITLYAQWTKPTESNGKEKGYSYVDLGLPSGTKWATMNVGAESPSDFGDFFAWGETQPKGSYSWDNYKWGNEDEFTKYSSTDNKTVLESLDDAASVNWGGSWRMPTNNEMQELFHDDNCTSTKGYLDGKLGYIIESKKNGNSIFIRFDTEMDIYSRTDYWSSTLINVNMAETMFNYYYGKDKYVGNAVRPVIPERDIYTIKFEANGGEGYMSYINAKYADVITLPQNTFTREGYAFNGWTTHSPGSEGHGDYYENKATFSVFKDLTLYAIWIDKEHENYTPEIENPGEGKVTICVRTPEKMCGTIATPGHIASGEWQVGNAYENGQALELLDGYDNWYIGTFDYSDDYFNEFKIVATDESGNWTWSNQTNDYEIKSGDCTNHGYSQHNIQIEHDDQVIFIVINSFQVNPCEEVAPAGLATFNLTPIGFPDGTEFYVTGSFDDYYWEWQELIEEFKLTLQSDGTYSAQIEVPESFTYRYIPVHPDESFDPMYPERDLVMPVNLITNDTIEYFEEEYEYQ